MVHSDTFDTKNQIMHWRHEHTHRHSLYYIILCAKTWGRASGSSGAQSCLKSIKIGRMDQKVGCGQGRAITKTTAQPIENIDISATRNASTPCGYRPPKKPKCLFVIGRGNELTRFFCQWLQSRGAVEVFAQAHTSEAQQDITLFGILKLSQA